MAWNPNERIAVRVALRPDGKYAGQVRVFTTRQQLQPDTPTYRGYKEMEKYSWDDEQVSSSLFEICVWLYALAMDQNRSIESIDLGALDPLGTEVTFIREQFARLTV